jgi:diketogulonate reductase-like aldo/keto reductase
MHLQQDGKIWHLGLTNFDTAHMVDLIDAGAPIVSNQVPLQSTYPYPSAARH